MWSHVLSRHLSTEVKVILGVLCSEDFLSTELTDDLTADGWNLALMITRFTAVNLVDSDVYGLSH